MSFKKIKKFIYVCYIISVIKKYKYILLQYKSINIYI